MIGFNMKEIETLKGGVALGDIKRIYFSQYVAGIRNVPAKKRYNAFMLDMGLLMQDDYPDTTASQSERPKFESVSLLTWFRFNPGESVIKEHL